MTLQKKLDLFSSDGIQYQIRNIRFSIFFFSFSIYLSFFVFVFVLFLSFVFCTQQAVYIHVAYVRRKSCPCCGVL